MSDRELLLNLGYREVSRERFGCVLQVWWAKPGDSESHPQGWLAIVERQKIKRLKEYRKNALGSDYVG